MFEKLISKIISENITPIQNISQKRIENLKYIKSKIYNNPQEVEEWFNNEIKKLSNVDINSSIKEILHGGSSIQD